MKANYAKNISKMNAPSLDRIYAKIEKTALEGGCRIQITLIGNEVDALKLKGYVVGRHSLKSNLYEVSWY